MCSSGCVVAIVLLAAAAPAQDQQQSDSRVVQLGTALGSDGLPWARATVTLWSRRPFRAANLVPEDIVTVRTDARGRFRASLLPGRAYIASARIGEGDATRYSSLFQVSASRPVHLREGRFRPRPVRLELVGVAAWKEHGPLRARVSDALGRSIDLALDETGSAVIPATLATHGVVLEILDRAGAKLTSRNVSLLLDQRVKDRKRLAERLKNCRDSKPVPGLPDVATQAVPPAEVERVLVGPPRRASVRVVDAETKQAIAGAVVRLPHLRHSAKTGKDGVANFVICRTITWEGRPDDFGYIRVEAAAAGYGTRQGGWTTSRPDAQETRISKEAARARDLPVTTIALPRGSSVRGRILGTRDVPASALRLMARYRVRQAAQRREHVFTCDRVLTPEGQGRWRLIGLDAACDKLLIAVLLGPAHVRALDPKGQMSASSYAIIPIPVPAGGGEVADLDLTKLRFTTLVVRKADGELASGANVRPWLASWFARRAVPTSRVDRRGRCRLLLPPGNSQVVVQWGSEYAIVDIDGAKPPPRVDVQLLRMKSISGKIVDPRGKPVDGAWIHSDTFAEGSTAIHDLNTELLRTSSGPAGRFSLNFVPDPGRRWRLAVRKLAGPRWIQGGVVLTLDDESIRDLEIAIR